MVKDLLARWAYEHQVACKKSMVILNKKLATTSLNLLLIVGTLTLMILSWVIIDSVQHWALRWQQGEARIALYLDLSTTAQAEQDLLLKIRTTPGVLGIDKVSSEQGLAELQKQQGMQELLRDLPSNPLPIVINITPESKIDTPQKLKKLYNTVSSYPLVAHATLDLEWLEQVQTWVNCFIGIIHFGMILVGCMVLLNIGHSLRLLVAERASDIGLLLRMGAAESWIMRPFLYLGSGYGLIGACLATCVVELICYLGNQALRNTSVSLGWQPEYLVLSFADVVGMIIITTCLSWVFAFFFVRHHVRSIDCVDGT